MYPTEDRIMTAIERNGLSGLALKIAAITLVAILSGFMPKPPAKMPFSAEAQAVQADL